MKTQRVRVTTISDDTLQDLERRVNRVLDVLDQPPVNVQFEVINRYYEHETRQAPEYIAFITYVLPAHVKDE